MQPDRSTKLYLVRHGETTWNAQKLLMGRGYDSPLTERGVAQAREVAAQLVDIPFVALYSSTLGRSWKTAELLAESLQLNPIQPVPDLEERNYGPFGGKPWTEFRAAMEVWEPIRDQLPEADRWAARVHPDVESDADVMNRVIPALQTIAVNHHNQHVLVVAHGGVLRTLLRFLGNQNRSLTVPGAVTNGGIVVLDVSDDNLVVHSVDGLTTYHLSE